MKNENETMNGQTLTETVNGFVATLSEPDRVWNISDVSGATPISITREIQIDSRKSKAASNLASSRRRK